ncbi:protein Abitram-like [Corticium candelabrum]|uniref:protein Abitram-like n=1 Tax=Corticium candelabrum TaxID=121492 RepID=UPI002E26BC6B|nr:protein Abitram-like [Corticium candelabrum]
MASSELSKAMDEFGVTGEHVPYIQRYFKRGYAIDVKGRPREDHCVLQHSNRMCVLCLAPSHPIVCNKDVQVTKVDYKVTNRLDRTKNKVVGKRKKGAQWLNPLSPVCIVYCSDGSQYTTYSCIRSSLLEINDQLLVTPNLLKDAPEAEGYLAILRPKFAESADILQYLETEENYKQKRQQRDMDEVLK